MSLSRFFTQTVPLAARARQPSFHVTQSVTLKDGMALKMHAWMNNVNDGCHLSYSHEFKERAPGTRFKDDSRLIA